MRRAIRIISIGATVAFAACFGAGPTPSPAADAPVVFAVPPVSLTASCTLMYIGDVAFGADAGYAILLPYAPQDNNCGGQSPGGSLLVQQFDKDVGGMPTTLGDAGVFNNGLNDEPRIVASGSSAAWAYGNFGGSNALTLEPAGTTITGTSGVLSPVGLVSDDSGIFVAAAGALGGASANSPNFPCFGQCDTTNNNVPGVIAAIPNGGSATVLAMPLFSCDAVDRCLVGNTASLYYFDTPPEMVGSLPPVVRTITKAGVAAPDPIATFSSTAISKPAGIDATDSTVAWSSTIDFALQQNQNGCSISAYDLASGVTTPLLTTTQFSCMGMAVDGTSAYFAIVSLFTDSDNGNQGTLRGDGIGRIDLVTKELESVELGVVGSIAGPRRIYLDGDNLFAIDPYAIAKIAKSTLAGQHDFAP